MKLISDTIGRKENPTEKDIEKAIAYAGDKFRNNDIVKLEKDQDNCLVLWIRDKQTGHCLELIENGKKKIECVSKFDSEAAIQIMINYLNGNVDWVKKYQWKTSAIVKFLDNLDRLRKSEFS